MSHTDASHRGFKGGRCHRSGREPLLGPNDLPMMMDFITFRTGRSHRLLFQRRLLQVKSYSARFKNKKTEQREAPSVRRPLLPSYSSECLSEKRKQKLQGPTKISAADFKCDTWGLFAQFPHVVDGCGGVEPPGSVVVLQTGLGLDLDSWTHFYLVLSWSWTGKSRDL